MGKIVISGEPSPGPFTRGAMEAHEGLGLCPSLIIDQHFIARRRMNRLLSAVLDHPGYIGVGLGEATAIIVRGKRFTVMGENSVIVIDPRAAKLAKSAKDKLQSAASLKMHVLKAGQEFLFGGK